MTKLTSIRPETNDTKKTTIGVSLRVSLIDKVRTLSEHEDRNFSSMCSVLLGEALEARNRQSTEN